MSIAFTIPIWAFWVAGGLAAVPVLLFAIVGWQFMKGFGGGIRY